MAKAKSYTWDFNDLETGYVDPGTPFSEILDLIGVPGYGDRGKGEVLLLWEYDGDSLLKITTLKKRRLRN